MSSYFFLIPISLFLALSGLLAFVWALRHGQYDDVKGAAHRILTDEDVPVQERAERRSSRDPEATDVANGASRTGVELRGR